MRVLLVSNAPEFPLATYCLAAHVRGSEGLADCEVDMLDLDWTRLSSYERKNAEIWRYLARLERAQPDVVGFSIYLWNHLAFRELAAITRAVVPSIRIVVGGPELATPEAAEPWLAKDLADVAVRGEGEQTFVRVLERLADGDGTHGIPGTSAAVGGDVVHEPPAAPMRDLASLPSPFLTGLAAPELFERRGAIQDAPYSRALLETYRGCYMHCAYCQWGNGTPMRTPFAKDRVYRELTWLLEHDVRSVFIVDAMFGFKKAGAIELLEFIAAEKRRLGATTTFSAYHNQDFFDPRLFEAYREAGVYIEIDLQSTNGDVLDRLGRGRWRTDSFERHLAEIRSRRVPTTGAADLIVGIPGDDLRSFECSVDYLLRHGLRVNLYHASVLPDTDWSRRAATDGTVFSPVPPRPILETSHFPLRDMVAARLIGHGTDLFNSFPRTAALLWRRWYSRPVDLCRAMGKRVYDQHGVMYGESHQYDWVMRNYLDRLPEVIRELCPDEEAAEILVELMLFEGALAAAEWSRPAEHVAPAVDWAVEGEGWLDARPRFRGEAVQRLELEYAVGELALDWDAHHDPEALDRVRRWPHVALVYSDGQPQHRAIDLGFTDHLLRRLNGHFTVREALDSAGLWLSDMSPAWGVLEMLAEAGVIMPGPDEDRGRTRASPGTARAQTRLA